MNSHTPLITRHMQILASVVLLLTCANCSFAGDRTAPLAEDKTFSILDIYQGVISRADGHRCPMHPSCSAYAKSAVRQYGFIKGWVLTCDRLLRCGRDEPDRAPGVQIGGRRRVYDPLSSNVFWWDHKDRD